MDPNAGITTTSSTGIGVGYYPHINFLGIIACVRPFSMGMFLRYYGFIRNIVNSVVNSFVYHRTLRTLKNHPFLPLLNSSSGFRVGGGSSGLLHVTRSLLNTEGKLA
jgi:hypothetical protein